MINSSSMQTLNTERLCALQWELSHLSAPSVHVRITCLLLRLITHTHTHTPVNAINAAKSRGGGKQSKAVTASVPLPRCWACWRKTTGRLSLWGSLNSFHKTTLPPEQHLARSYLYADIQGGRLRKGEPIERRGGDSIRKRPDSRTPQFLCECVERQRGLTGT